jgi:N-acetylmuramoyl-L-alanine amidase
MTATIGAAELRRRSYRSFHVKTDAREAIELFRAAEKGAPVPVSCNAGLSAVLLEAEIEAAPQKAYISAFVKKKTSSPECAEIYEKALSKLAAFRPDMDKISLASDATATGAADTPNGASDGPVVSPTTDMVGGPATISQIESFGARDVARVVIRLTSPVAFQVGYIESPDASKGMRIYVDLPQTKRGDGHLERDVGSGLLERVRLGNRGGSTRVVLDLNERAYRRVFFLPEPFRVVVDVSTRPFGGAPAAPSPNSGQRLIQRVAIDPGHGGNDPGATGPSGLKEKDVTLDIAHRVAPILSHEMGVSTMLTRDDDRYVPLEERTARANAFHAELFVSIHCNASENPSGRGVQSYVLDTSRDDIALKVAARENASTAAAIPGTVLSQLRSGELGNQSQHLAALIQQATMSSLHERYGDTPNGGVHAAAFYVLVGSEMPAVLFETSFISSPIEETRLASADYRQKLADAIANAIRAFREGR